LSSNGFAASAMPGKNGQFDVVRDGDLVYSKEREHRFPDPGEVLSLLQG
jgi:predicted Rdx family selenoprotein